MTSINYGNPEGLLRALDAMRAEVEQHFDPVTILQARTQMEQAMTHLRAHGYTPEMVGAVALVSGLHSLAPEIPMAYLAFVLWIVREASK